MTAPPTAEETDGPSDPEWAVGFGSAVTIS